MWAALAAFLRWFFTGTTTPVAPSSPAFTLKTGLPGMAAAYLATVSPPASKDPSAVRTGFVYTVTPGGVDPRGVDPTSVELDPAKPLAIGLNPGETLTGQFRTADANGVLSPFGPAASVIAPVAPSAPTFSLANAPADPPQPQ